MSATWTPDPRHRKVLDLGSRREAIVTDMAAHHEAYGTFAHVCRKVDNHGGVCACACGKIWYGRP